TLQLREFFATITHELKTALASVRIQGESLGEDLKNSEHQILVNRLVADTVRLELQLENSLFLAHADQDQMFFEKADLQKTILSFQHQFPQLRLIVEKNAALDVDKRCFESILKNLIQNAFYHGQATEVRFSSEILSAKNSILLSIQDNGVGFRGDTSKLGELFSRHSSSSGSGVGLYLVQDLVRKMNGQVRWIKNLNSGFKVEIELRGVPV
ncbi:MAG: sensor histidine kinase, partial [Pseudobdellovibrionaceae bacterium]